MVDPALVLKYEPPIVIDLTEDDDEERFDINLPDGWLHAFTPAGINRHESQIINNLSQEMIRQIRSGMSHYPYDHNNTLLPLFAFRAGFLPVSLFNYIYRKCTYRTGESDQAACKRVMYILNTIWARIVFYDDSKLKDGIKEEKRPEKK